jgi:hypothetical protein
MIEEGVKVLIRCAAVFAAEAGDFLGVCSVDSGDFDAGDGACGASVRLRDVAAADEADMKGHGELSVTSLNKRRRIVGILAFSK